MKRVQTAVVLIGLNLCAITLCSGGSRKQRFDGVESGPATHSKPARVTFVSSAVFELDMGLPAIKQGDKIVFVKRSQLGPVLMGSGVIKMAYAKDSMGGATAMWKAGKYEDMLACEAYVVDRSSSPCSFTDFRF